MEESSKKVSIVVVDIKDVAQLDQPPGQDAYKPRRLSFSRRRVRCALANKYDLRETIHFICPNLSCTLSPLYLFRNTNGYRIL